MAVHQGIAHGKALGQTDQRVVNRLVAVRVILAQHVAHAGRGLFKGLVAGEAHLVHGVEDAAVDGLQPVSHVGQGAADNDAHGVLNVGRLHLMLQVDIDYFLIGIRDILVLVAFFHKILVLLSVAPWGRAAWRFLCLLIKRRKESFDAH